MNKTNIEWVKNPDETQGYTWNPITGCLNHNNGLCKGGGFPCYAYGLANGRLKPLYLANDNIATTLTGSDLVELHKAYCDPFYPRLWEDRLEEPIRGYHFKLHFEQMPQFAAKPKGIFACDMGDLFGIGIPEEWTRRVLKVAKTWENRFDRFYLLTKQPQNLIKFSPFPENCWVGVTATNTKGMNDALHFNPYYKAKVKYISFEPLLEGIDKSRLALYRYDWIIIGACTGSLDDMMNLCDRYPDLVCRDNHNFTKFVALPKLEWVKEIVEAADKAGVKVFQKNNLRPLLGDKLRQELPR